VFEAEVLRSASAAAPAAAGRMKDKGAGPTSTSGLGQDEPGDGGGRSKILYAGCGATAALLPGSFIFDGVNTSPS